MASSIFINVQIFVYGEAGKSQQNITGEFDSLKIKRNVGPYNELIVHNYSVKWYPYRGQNFVTCNIPIYSL